MKRNGIDHPVLVFVRGDGSDMSEAIVEASSRKDRFDHVGIYLPPCFLWRHLAEIDYASEAVAEMVRCDVDLGTEHAYVLEAHPDLGVSATPYSQFYNRTGGDSHLLFMEFPVVCDVKKSIINALRVVGEPYNAAFLEHVGENRGQGYYCSELVAEFCRDTSGGKIFHNHKLNFCSADGSLIPFWKDYYQELGLSVPLDEQGTSPQSVYERCLEFADTHS